MAPKTANRVSNSRNNNVVQSRFKHKRKNGPNSNQRPPYGMAERQKNALMRNYKKLLNKERQHLPEASPRNPDHGVANEDEFEIPPVIPKKLKMNTFQRAQEQLRWKQEQKEEQEKERQRIREEKKEAIQRYQQQKMERLKILRRKTKKGQPIMKGRIELLLKQIQNSIS